MVSAAGVSPIRSVERHLRGSRSPPARNHRTGYCRPQQRTAGPTCRPAIHGHLAPRPGRGGPSSIVARITRIARYISNRQWASGFQNWWSPQSIEPSNQTCQPTAPMRPEGTDGNEPDQSVSQPRRRQSGVGNGSRSCGRPDDEPQAQDQLWRPRSTTGHGASGFRVRVATTSPTTSPLQASQQQPIENLLLLYRFTRRKLST